MARVLPDPQARLASMLGDLAKRLSALERGLRAGPVYQDYTPTWTATGSAPSYGNATVSARYCRSGNRVHAIGRVTLGSTSSVGSGDWHFALPVPASTDPSNSTGLGYFFTANFQPVLASFQSGGLTTAFLYAPTYGSGIAVMGASNPGSWTTGHQFGWNFSYEAA